MSLNLSIFIIITHLYLDDRLAIGVEEGIDRSPFTPNTQHCDDFTENDRPYTHQERSPFLVSDDRSRKMKERSPISQELLHTL
ncbi:hypothetical protein QUA56_02900 [Microcoleus sp. N3A4]|uniref:hypothetical protein n=1 Tax=Microcoleus sp. N3A4 TaxID=3055379 RepID=UPI002FCF445F